MPTTTTHIPLTRYLWMFSLCAGFGASSLTGEDRSLGALVSDTPLYQFESILEPRAGLATAMDLSYQLPPIGNQGPYGSCVGWALAYALKTQQEQAERSWGVNVATHQFSPLWVYNQIKLNGLDQGSKVEDAIELLKSRGCATLADFNPANPYVAVPPTSYPQYAIESSSYVSNNAVAVKKVLNQGRPVVAVVEAYPDFDGLSSTNQVYDTISGVSRGRHAICIVGYDDSLGAFKFANSWTTTWGIAGYGWISYSMIANPQAVVRLYDVIDKKAAVGEQWWFGQATWAANQGGFWDTQKWLAGDFTGDGICDLVNVYNNGGMANMAVHPSNGSAIYGAASWVDSGMRRNGWPATSMVMENVI